MATKFTPGPWRTELVLPGAALDAIENRGMVASVYGLSNGMLTEHGIFGAPGLVNTFNAGDRGARRRRGRHPG